ncbi:hypothetical protein [Tenacibaculum finnmarkense]|uniref:hypothetical protein n=1 Tax=Tenacibaculum finnmarkense TaxID=2781243 RepID=UPI000C407A44|nr:hypothetical protein [Tenacibaculum finnmarkense]MCD8440902.1 hypothetical protein [Tenacibaculum finnmarkense genomovar ulcerans]MCG8721825.1 hypothetical protein [Tenacibaculum finnmarkense]SOS56197.1 hypothetical protein TFHFJT_680001 [Tenacibaculum finnmarkense]
MEEILKKEYSKLLCENITPTGKVNLLNNIVQFKLNETEYKKFHNDLSIDIKRYLNSLIELAENGARNYDIINEDKLMFLNEVSFSDKIIYIDYFIRILEKSAFKEDIKTLQKIKYESILKQSWQNIWSFKSILNILIYFPLYNIYTLLVSLILITLITNLILLPAPFNFMSLLCFKIDYLTISSNYNYNHFLNVTSSLIGVNNKFSITPLDSKSMIILIFGKIFVFFYVVTLIFNKLTDLIKR